MTEGPNAFGEARIGLNRLTRRLVGPGGRETVLPVLSVRLLDALAMDAPRFVDSATLASRVWPGLHISADTLKQRVRLLRSALADVGYDPRLIDSARGEGYALLATIEDTAMVGRPAAPEVGAPRVAGRRWGRGLAAGVALLVVIGSIAALLSRSSTGSSGRPLGPTPVRIAYESDVPESSAGAIVRGAARLPDVLLVVSSAQTACQDSERAHLCLKVESGEGRGSVAGDIPAGGSAASSVVSLVQVGTGATLLRWDLLPGAGHDSAAFGLQLAQFATPGVMRWLGGRTGAGDREFSAYREGVRRLGGCASSDLSLDVDQLAVAAERAPHFTSLRALRLLLAVEEALARNDDTSVARHRAAIEALLLEDDRQALAHLALARAVAPDDPRAATSVARAMRLQPILEAFAGPDGVPRLVGGSANCGRN